MLRKLAQLFCLFAAIAVSPGTAKAVLVNPGEQLEISFGFPSPPVVSGGVDTLLLTAGSSSIGVSGIQVDLFDGSSLLATNSTALTSIWAFTSPGSLYSGNDVNADLTSVIDGTILGRLLVTPSFSDPAGFFDIAPIVVGTARGAGLFSFFSATPDATFTATVIPVRVSVPEPTTLWLFVIGLAGMGILGRRRRASA